MRCTWVSAYGIGYGVSVALAYLIATDGISYFVAVATADMCSRDEAPSATPSIGSQANKHSSNT